RTNRGLVRLRMRLCSELKNASYRSGSLSGGSSRKRAISSSTAFCTRVAMRLVGSLSLWGNTEHLPLSCPKAQGVVMHHGGERRVDGRAAKHDLENYSRGEVLVDHPDDGLPVRAWVVDGGVAERLGKEHLAARVKVLERRGLSQRVVGLKQ